MWITVFARKRQIKILQYDIIQHISMTLPAWGFCKTFKRWSRREPDSYITNLMICQNSKRDVKGQKIILVQGIRIRIFVVIQFLTGIEKNSWIMWIMKHIFWCIIFSKQIWNGYVYKTHKLWMNSKWNPFTFKIRFRISSQEVLPEILHLSYLRQKCSISGLNRKWAQWVKILYYREKIKTIYHLLEFWKVLRELSS